LTLRDPGCRLPTDAAGGRGRNILNAQLSQAVVHIREMTLRAEIAPGQRVAEAPVAEKNRRIPFAGALKR